MLTSCRIKASTDGGAASGKLPKGRLDHGWSLEPGPAPCFNFVPRDGAPAWRQDPTSGPWGGAGSAKPAAKDVQALAAQLCGGADKGGQALLRAFKAGGQDAQAAVAGILAARCPSPQALPDAFAAFGSAPELQNPGTAMRWVEGARGQRRE